MGFTVVQKSLQSKEIEKVRLGIIGWILLSSFTCSTTSSGSMDYEILDLTERSCCQVKITEQTEWKRQNWHTVNKTVPSEL